MSDSNPPPRSRRPVEDEPEGSKLFTYLLPFLAALFVALGIAGSVVGGWAAVQPAIGGCSDPTIVVSSPAETEDRVEDARPVIETVAFEDLTRAERRAVEEAVGSVHREGTVDGAFDNREAFERGVLVEYEGEELYATLASENRCLSVDPLVLPLGLVSLLLGVGGFTHVAYRNYPRRFRLPFRR